MSDETEELETKYSELEEKDSAPKRRGRKPGVKLEVRPAFWIGIALLNGKLIHERLQAPDEASDEEKKNYSEEAARAVFKQKFDTEPEVMYGPCRDYKVQKVTNISQKKDVIQISSEDVSFGKRICASAEFNGWVGQVYEVKTSNSEDFAKKYSISAEDCGIFWPIKEAKPSPDGKKRSVPANSVVLLSSLNLPNNKLQNN